MTQTEQNSPPAAPPERGSLGWPAQQIASIRAYFRDLDPTFWVALTPALLLSAVLFVRSPASNYIFDEQEALLANPYVNAQAGLGFWDAVRRDFWGLPADRSIGSYRPIPNFIWRLLWHVSHEPFLHHWVNVVGHAANAALVASLALTVTRRRLTAWLAGGLFVTCALLTEAVSGVVGIADVLGGLGVLLAVRALTLPLYGMPFAVFAALCFGLFSKESAIVGVPLIAWAALLLAPVDHQKPRRHWRVLFALLAGVLALVFYTEFRRRFFPVSPPSDLTTALPPGTGLPRRALRAFLLWFQQPQLPNDPINNPLVRADLPHRVAGGLRVFARGLGQLLVPWPLSGDYSFPQEPVPTKLVFPASVIGAVAMLGLPLLALVAWCGTLLRELLRRAESPASSLRLVALGALWLPIAYFPHSNIPVLLPTVRAERFWYLPAVGAAWLLAAWFERGLGRNWKWAPWAIGAFFAMQAVTARVHALDYSDDLMFWDSTRRAATRSAKAHLNYSVMVGARGKLEERLEANRRALELAPDWPMASVYYGDTLCRMKQPDAAYPHYRRGFELAPNDPNLVALGLQCLWDQNGVESRKTELLELAGRHPGSWLSLLATELVYYGKEHGGIQQKYRPRSYNEGPKSD